MPVAPGYLDYVMELLSPIGEVAPRAMFGGYGIFHEGDMFGLVSGSNLYFKVGDLNRAAFENAGSPQFKPMPYYEVPADILEDSDAMENWARDAIEVGHATAKKKRR